MRAIDKRRDACLNTAHDDTHRSEGREMNLGALYQWVTSSTGAAVCAIVMGWLAVIGIAYGLDRAYRRWPRLERWVLGERQIDEAAERKIFDNVVRFRGRS